MNPIDVCRTRYYNQTYDASGKGVLYTSGMDAFKKITANEGMKAFYKGFFTHFLRIGPHFCLTFVFLGVLKRNLQSYKSFLDHKETYYNADTDFSALTETEMEN
jgi:Mitochondrial carrier protein